MARLPCATPSSTGSPRRSKGRGFTMIARLALAVLLSWCSFAPAFAAPARIILLRHGEKAGAWKLCGVGQARADALAATYLGRNAAQSLFAAGEEPAAFLAITLHTLELASPAAATWDLPVTMFSVLPQKATEAVDKAANLRTEEAAAALLANPAWQRKTVVMVWEHKHIANAKLAAKSSGEAVTLRQLLQLDKLKDVPETWPAANYDYRRLRRRFHDADRLPHGEAGVRRALREAA